VEQRGPRDALALEAARAAEAYAVALEEALLEDLCDKGARLLADGGSEAVTSSASRAYPWMSGSCSEAKTSGRLA